MSRPWRLQARFVQSHNNAWSSWHTVQSYGTEDKAREAEDRYRVARGSRANRHETRVRVRTAEAFISEYAARAGMSVSRLVEGGSNVERCDCDDVRCLGWKITGAA